MIKFVLACAGSHNEHKDQIAQALQTVKDQFKVQDVIKLAYNGPIRDLHNMFQDYFQQYGVTTQPTNPKILRTVAALGHEIYGPNIWTDMLHTSLREIAKSEHVMGIVITDVVSRDQLAQVREFIESLGQTPFLTALFHQEKDKSANVWDLVTFDTIVDPDHTVLENFSTIAGVVQAKLPAEPPAEQKSCHTAVDHLNIELKNLFSHGYGAQFQWVYDKETGCKQLRLQKLEKVVKLDKTEEQRLAEFAQKSLSEAKPAVPVQVPHEAISTETTDGSGQAAGEVVSAASTHEDCKADDSGNPHSLDGAGGSSSDGDIRNGLAKHFDGNHHSGVQGAVGT